MVLVTEISWWFIVTFQPSRAKAHVSAAIAGLLFITGFSLFLFYSQSVDFRLGTPPHTLVDTNPIRRYYLNKTELVVKFSVTNQWVLENRNFYAVTLKSLRVQASVGGSDNFTDPLVGDVMNQTALMLAAKSSAVVTQSIDITFQGDLAFMVHYCTDPRLWVHTTFMKFEAMAQVSVLGNTISKCVTSYQYASCYHDPWPALMSRSPTKQFFSTIYLLL